MSTKFAVGPWRVHPPDERGHILVTSGIGADVADVIAGPHTAALIVAAPELLEALMLVIKSGWSKHAESHAYALIARIKGAPGGGTP